MRENPGRILQWAAVLVAGGTGLSLAIGAFLGVTANRLLLTQGDESQRMLGSLYVKSSWHYMSPNRLFSATWSGVHRTILRLIADVVPTNSLEATIHSVQMASIGAAYLGAAFVSAAVALGSTRMIGCLTFVLLIGAFQFWDTGLGAMPGAWSLMFVGIGLYLWFLAVRDRRTALLLMSAVAFLIAVPIRHEVGLTVVLLAVLSIRRLGWWRSAMFLAIGLLFTMGKGGVSIYEYVYRDSGYLKLWTDPNYDFGSGILNSWNAVESIWLYCKVSVVVVACVALVYVIVCVTPKPCAKERSVPCRPWDFSRASILVWIVIAATQSFAMVALTFAGALDDQPRYMLYSSVLLVGLLTSWCGLLMKATPLKGAKVALVVLGLIFAVSVVSVLSRWPQLSGTRGILSGSEEVRRFLTDREVPSNALAVDRMTSSNQYMLYGWQMDEPHLGWSYSFRPAGRLTSANFSKVDSPLPGSAEWLAGDLHRYLARGLGEYLVIPNESYYRVRAERLTTSARHLMPSYVWPFMVQLAAAEDVWVLDSPWYGHLDAPVLLVTAMRNKSKHVLENLSASGGSGSLWQPLRHERFSAKVYSSPQIDGEVLVSAGRAAKFRSCDNGLVEFGEEDSAALEIVSMLGTCEVSFQWRYKSSGEYLDLVAIEVGTSPTRLPLSTLVRGLAEGCLHLAINPAGHHVLVFRIVQ